MKYLIIIFLLSSVSALAQADINQFDAEGQRHGIWKKKYPGTQQLRYEGQFEHGREVGTFRFYCKSCGSQPTTVMEYHQDGTATVSYFTPKGHLVSTGTMRQKKRVGDWVYYHKGSKKIMMREQYENDLLHGEKQTYYPSGQLAETQRYEKGEAHGENRYYSPEGVLIKNLQYALGKLEGPASYYDASGNLIIEGTYKNGQKHGLWKCYEEGKLTKEETFPKKYE